MDGTDPNATTELDLLKLVSHGNDRDGLKKYNCGVCNKPVKDSANEIFHSKCILCTRRYAVHKSGKCAGRLWSNSELSKLSPKVPTASTFNNQLSLGLMCNACKKPCFLCKPAISHIMGKL